MRQWSLLPYAEAFVTVLLWSHVFVVVKYCLDYVTPLELVVLRHVPAALVYMVYLAIGGGFRDIGRMIRQQPLLVVAVSLAAVVAYHLPLNWGSQHVPAGTVSIIIGLGPVFTFTFATLFLGERHTWVKITGALIAFGGVYVCVRYAAGRSISITYWLGALVTMIAPAVAGAHTALYRVLGQRFGALRTASASIVIGTIPTLFFLTPASIERLPLIPLKIWALILFLGLGCTALAYFLWAHALAHAEASRITVFAYLMPPLGLVWAWLYLGEPVNVWLVVGAALIVAGVVMTNGRHATGTRA